MKTILILGGGRWQCPLILKAKSLGIRVVCMDQDRLAPGLIFSDIPLVCNIKDHNAILEKINSIHIDGLAIDQTEIPIHAARKVADILGLTFIPQDVIDVTTNKLKMRQRWLRDGICVPEFKQINSYLELIQFANQVGYPVVTKPLDSMGSQGVCICMNEEDLQVGYKEAVEYSTNNKDVIIAEKFIEGREYTIEAFSYLGKTKVLGISQKSKSKNSPQVSSMLEYPPDLNSDQIYLIEDFVINAINSLGILNGPSHSEVILKDESIAMVETASRGGGFGISSEIIPLVSGFDHLQAILKLALNEKVLMDFMREKNAVTLGFFESPKGRIKKIHGINDVMRLESLRAIEFFKVEGDEVEVIKADRGRSGYFLLQSFSKERLRREAEVINKKIKFEID
ncbi:ATP-grasp domain-containing protein [Polynucleobacter sp. AP-Sanab-80-C2]|uniref:ATP-grasp domain-containing protein n=1 Tax=Polynucleobacter sp. AP-Sanab-80-C2 TaxID=3108274 RepID=UPI002B226B58|nr:ATP-grasp domain-containing protein [Polynucleobacter sp. AP-Sanab-80-C2]MEA9598565.1 ATP-grasp domain-containing protein [Polynucleobacter sp. AP-Sanab-80-C2]